MLKVCLVKISKQLVVCYVNYCRVYRKRVKLFFMSHGFICKVNMSKQDNENKLEHTSVYRCSNSWAAATIISIVDQSVSYSS